MNVCVNTVALLISTAKAICGKRLESYWYVIKVLIVTTFYPSISQGTDMLDEVTEAEVFELLHQRLYDEPIEVHTEMGVHCRAIMNYVPHRL